LNLVQVLIATTAGPVVVERITEEVPEVDSVICLQGKAVALPISNAYNSFVREPTGVVQRYFGHAAYRIDVSATVDEGYSWQLGAFAAHALRAESRLAKTHETIDTALFITGEVNRDLNVLSVDHIAGKLEKLAAQVTTFVPDGATILIVLPKENESDVEEDWCREHGLISENCRILFVDHINQLLQELGLKEIKSSISVPRAVITPSAAPAVPATQRTTPRRLAFLTIAFLLGLGSIFIVGFQTIYAEWIEDAHAGKFEQLERYLNTVPAKTSKLDTLKISLFRSYLNWRRPSDRSVQIDVVEKRPPDGQSCAAVRFGKTKAQTRSVRAISPSAFQPSRLENLCALDIKAYAAASVYLWGRYERQILDRGSAESVHRKILYLGPQRDAINWSLEIPRRLRQDVAFEVLILAAHTPIDGREPWLKKILGKLNEKTLSPIAQRLNTLGITVRLARYKIIH